MIMFSVKCLASNYSEGRAYISVIINEKTMSLRQPRMFWYSTPLNVNNTTTVCMMCILVRICKKLSVVHMY